MIQMHWQALERADFAQSSKQMQVEEYGQRQKIE